MEIEELEKWLEENGWEHRTSEGRIEIANPKFGTRKEYAVSAVAGSSLQNILLPHFLERWHRAGDNWEHMDTARLHL